MATAESFPPVFHGNHIVNLPDFNSLRRMMHSVCDSMHRPDSHVSNSCLASYFLPYTLFIFLTPVSSESGTFSLPLIFNIFKSVFKSRATFSNCAHFQFSKYTTCSVSQNLTHSSSFVCQFDSNGRLLERDGKSSKLLKKTVRYGRAGPCRALFETPSQSTYTQ